MKYWVEGKGFVSHGAAMAYEQIGLTVLWSVSQSDEPRQETQSNYPPEDVEERQPYKD